MSKTSKTFPDGIATWQQRMPQPRYEKQCDMNCSPRNPAGCDDCYTAKINGDPIKARDEEIAALRAVLRVKNKLAALAGRSAQPLPTAPDIRVELVEDPVNGGMHIRKWENIGGLSAGTHDLCVKRPAASREPVKWATEVTYGEVRFNIGHQYFTLRYDPSDDPEDVRDEQLEWMRSMLEKALSKLAAPATQAVVPDDINECAEILENLIENIRAKGNYSVESTLLFLSNALACLSQPPAASVEAGS